MIREHYPDPTAKAGEPWVVVDVKAIGPMKHPVTLVAAKAEPRLKDMVLVNNTRLCTAGQRRRVEGDLRDGRRLNDPLPRAISARPRFGSASGSRKRPFRARLCQRKAENAMALTATSDDKQGSTPWRIGC